ncbi:hypothetical protein C0991_006876 [Blastosporella zonata]|nr:hypothetical protein C0991_006876 [Blastosporella zonata]
MITFLQPFTAPPTNQSMYKQWTVGAIYYSALIVADSVFGKSNVSQIVDTTNNGLLTPSLKSLAIRAQAFAEFLSKLLDTEQQPMTFATSAYTKTINTVSVNQAVLATSNGHSGKDRMTPGSTTPSSNGCGGGLSLAYGLTVIFALAAGTGAMIMTLKR